MTWTCASCSETHDDGFDACWRCGTSRSGARDTSFVHADDMRTKTESVDEAVLRRFRCARCDGKSARIKHIATTGTGPSRLLDVQNQRFMAVSCATCALVELYDLDVLQGPDRLGTALDALFGR